MKSYSLNFDRTRNGVGSSRRVRTASTFLFRHARRTTRKVVRRPASKPVIVAGVRADCGIIHNHCVLMSVGLMPLAARRELRVA